MTIYYKLLFLVIGLFLYSCSTGGSGSSPTGNETHLYDVTVSMTPSDGGTISPSADSSYEQGSQVSLQANPTEAYTFSGWTGTVDTTANPFTITVDKDYNLTANFRIKSYELSVNTTGEGTVTEQIVQQKTDYEYGTVVELTANPAKGWQFVEWQGDLTGSQNPEQITVDATKDITAVFDKKSFALTVNVSGNGSVTKNPNQTEYEFGTLVDLTANSDTGWEFETWDGDTVSTNNPVTLSIDSTMTINAKFKEVRTPIEGIISEDLALIKQDSPYEITGLVQIAYGATVTVEAGVEIYGNPEENTDYQYEGNKIEVFGHFLINGTESSKVILKNVKISPGDNTIDELYNIDMQFVDMIGGELYSPTGKSIYGSINLTDSFLYRVNRSEFIKTYMYIWYPQANSYIERNIFYNSGRISTGHRDANVYIRNNLFVRSNELSSEIGYAVENWASYDTSKTVIESNTFYNTDGVAVSLPSGYDSASMDATENYWSTLSQTIINDMIFDKNDDLSVSSTIPYEPILTEPDPQVPMLPDSLTN